LKILKLVIISIHIKNSPQAMPLAAALLKSQLDSLPEIKNKLSVSFMDFYMESSAEIIAESICGESPDIIGFSTYLWNRHLTEEICLIIKKRFPDITLFAGGAEATALPQNLLNSAPFDFVIKGEGELALTEVMKKFPENRSYKNIAGVYVKDSNGDAETNQWPVMNLDALPSPFLAGELDPEKYSGVLWELSRGCPFKCSFCFESRGVAGVRQFSLERIKKELELFELKKVNQVFVLDPTFNRDANRAKKILRMIQNIAPMMHFTFEVRTEFIDSEMAELFSMINCSLQIGLQSAIPEVLSKVNRKIDPDKYAEKISLLNSAGVIFGLDLIYGLPGDTLDGFKHSLDYALRLQPNHLDIFPLSVLPGTALYEDAEFFKLNYLKNAPYTLISSPGFSESDMSAAESLKNACTVFYNRGGAAGWMFMVLETLDINPSEFLEDFSAFIIRKKINSELSGEAITDIQLTFVKEQFSGNNLEKLFPVMADLIRFHGAVNCSLYAGPYSGMVNTPFNGKSVFKLSHGTRILELNYKFDELMTVGEFTLEEFLSHYRPEKTDVIVYNSGGEVKPLIVDKKISKLLQSFTGKNSLNESLMKNSSITKNEVYEFVEYALAETIIYRT
jgi:radical SAM superfamily enzyme YgiQ (UPF0313 family)